MSKLNLGLEIRDFDLDRMGFSLSVLDETKKVQRSEAYLRMTLQELGAFVNALKAARQEINVSTYEASGSRKLPSARQLDMHGNDDDDDVEHEVPIRAVEKPVVGRVRG